MMTTAHKAFLNRLIAPLAFAIARTGVSPSAITLAGVAASTGACLWFLSSRAVVPFCLAILATGCLDALDGSVARAAGRTSKFGAYLDAICDRYVDAIVAWSVAWVTGYWALITIVMAGALIISYAKARAAMEVPVSNLEWPDVMERTERSLIFVAGLAAGTLAPWKPLGRDLFWWTLVVLAVLVHATAVQRIRRARRYILAREPREGR